jgi:solute carrier family 44 protein 1 (choline transporter-like protein)
VILLLVLLVMRKRLELVVQLFREAGHAVHAMPLLVLLPLVVSPPFFTFAIDNFHI